jgi:hypothetical protein
VSTDAPRVPARYGRRSPKRAPALQLSRLLTGTIPAHPAAEDYLAALGGGWQMLGNDQAGDCVAVTWANVRRLVTSTLTATPVYPDQAQVWAIYETQNPGFDPAGSASANGPGSADDNGMDIQTLLEDLVANGGPDGVKAVSFASVNIADPDEVKAAIAIFGSVWTGINVSAANQDEFSAGQPWDWDASSPIEGGHSIITGGYGTPGAGPLGGDERFITWGAETSFTNKFWARSVEEAWVVIWPEHLGSEEFLAGVDLAALAADYHAITGTALPVAAPPSTSPVTKGGNIMLGALKAKLEAVWDKIDGEAEAELREAAADAKQALADIEAEAEKAEPSLTEFEAGFKALIVSAEPQLKADAEALLVKLLAAFAPLLAKASEVPEAE